jgi:hypothetical protein
VGSQIGGAFDIVDSERNPVNAPLSNVNDISVSSTPQKTVDLNYWKSVRRKWLESRGLKAFEERTLSFDDETVECIGGAEFQDVVHIEGTADAVAMECLSSGTLHFIFVGQKSKLHVFYSIISQIEKSEKQ